MKVVLIAPEWPPDACANGIVTYTGLLREGLAELGVQTRILVGDVTGASSDPEVVDLSRCGPQGARMVTLRERIAGRLRPNDLSTQHGARKVSRGLASLAPEFAPDVIEMEETFGIAGLLSKSVKAPVVVRLHGPWFLNGAVLGVPQNAAFRRRVALEGKAIANAQAISSPSKDLLDQVRRRYDLDLRHAEVIANPAPSVEAGQRWTLSECDPDLVLFVGRFDRHKGGDLAIDAFSRVAARRPGLKLVFIGPDRGLDDGHGRMFGLREYVSKHVPDPSVSSRIQCVGQLPPEEITNWRKKARATIVASRFEVFGMVVVEALAFGCPLIAANAGGIPEIVVNEENGLLFESGDTSGLADRLETMLDQPELSATLGRRGAMDVERRFAPVVIARQTKQYYERVLAG